MLYYDAACYHVYAAVLAYKGRYSQLRSGDYIHDFSKTGHRPSNCAAKAQDGKEARKGSISRYYLVRSVLMVLGLSRIIKEAGT
jgi:hypothetical protein